MSLDASRTPDEEETLSLLLLLKQTSPRWDMTYFTTSCWVARSGRRTLCQNSLAALCIALILTPCRARQTRLGFCLGSHQNLLARIHEEDAVAAREWICKALLANLMPNAESMRLADALTACYCTPRLSGSGALLSGVGPVFLGFAQVADWIGIILPAAGSSPWRSSAY